MKHRPTGIGVQGLADTFIKMRMAFDSLKQKNLIKKYLKQFIVSVSVQWN